MVIWSGKGNPKGACLDHDHRTGKIRAFLCPACNKAIGFAGDDPDRLTQLAHYLRKHKDTTMTNDNNTNETAIQVGEIVATSTLIPAKQSRSTPPSKYQPVIEKALTLTNGSGFQVFLPPGVAGIDFQRTITGVIRRFVSPTFKTLQAGMCLSVRQIKDGNKNVVAIAITCGPVPVKKEAAPAQTPQTTIAAKPAAAPVVAAKPAQKTGVVAAKR